jgi:hypothetical protein
VPTTDCRHGDPLSRSTTCCGGMVIELHCNLADRRQVIGRLRRRCCRRALRRRACPPRPPCPAAVRYRLEGSLAAARTRWPPLAITPVSSCWRRRKCPA